MKEEMVDTTYGDVFIKVSISFIRIPSLFSYDNLSIFDNILHINNTLSNNILISLQKYYITNNLFKYKKIVFFTFFIKITT